MHPTLFTIGKWSIPTYTVLLDLGLILGLVLTYFEGKRLLGKGETALELGHIQRGLGAGDTDLGRRPFVSWGVPGRARRDGHVCLGPMPEQ
jgi:hypothetical protein